FDTVTARFSDVTTAIATIDEANTVRDQEFESFVADTISSFDEVAETFASQNQAFTTLSQTLTSKIENDTDQAKNEAIATAQEYTRTAVGYCVDAEGNITSENDAVVCVDQGGSWVQGPLAEYISNLQISDGESTASIKELKQVFKKVNGELVARGGWQLDNNGRAVGVVGYNDGETGNLDLVGDVIRQGVMVGNTFVPTSYIDNTDPANPVHIFKGKMILGDNYAVESEADIRAKDGADGADGMTPTITTNPDGSYTISNGSETVTIRDGENAPIPTVTDNGNGTHTITDGSGNSIVVKDGENGYTPVKGTDYFDGNDGSYNSFIFTTGTTTPQTPTGGSFDGTNEIIPNGYKDSPYFEEGKITYVSKTMYINVGTAWVKSGWSKPAEYIIKGDTGESAYTNLIRPHGHWVTGRSGSQGIFSKKGTTEHNKVISGLGPQDTYEAIWISELANPEGAAGGWDVTVTDTDPTLSYRYSVWMREEQGEDHTLYLGCAPCKNLDNTDNNNPYFFTGNLPIKQKWYLVVGILHSSNKSNELTSGISGIYDPETGEKVITSPEFKQKEGVTTQIHRAFRFYAKNDSYAMFCRPRLEVIDGEEMSLGLLMGRIPKDGEDGKDGKDGKDGQNGQNGQDGTRGS
ncbi:hypothetical protein, partial [Pseudoalteromonas sp. TB51]|uniref:hypothetical protein n=1 Tax=Pseudoalteromonas sp. TB51 TaxID=1055803 RepID=UPI0004A33B99